MHFDDLAKIKLPLHGVYFPSHNLKPTKINLIVDTKNKADKAVKNRHVILLNAIKIKFKKNEPKMGKLIHSK